MKSVINSNFSHGFDKVSTLSASDAPLSANASRFSGLLASSLLLVIGAALCLMVLSLNSKILDSSLALTQKPSMISFKDYALLKIESKKQYGCLARLWGAESAWNPRAVGNLDGTHKVYGIPQGKSVYLSKVDGYKQIDWGLSYLFNRYNLDNNGYINACKALQHFRIKGWH